MPEDQRLHVPVLVEQVSLASPEPVGQVVVTARAAAILRERVVARRAGGRSAYCIYLVLKNFIGS